MLMAIAPPPRIRAVYEIHSAARAARRDVGRIGCPRRDRRTARCPRRAPAGKPMKVTNPTREAISAATDSQEVRGFGGAETSVTSCSKSAMVGPLSSPRPAVIGCCSVRRIRRRRPRGRTATSLHVPVRAMRAPHPTTCVRTSRSEVSDVPQHLVALTDDRLEPQQQRGGLLVDVVVRGGEFVHGRS